MTPWYPDPRFSDGTIKTSLFDEMRLQLGIRLDVHATAVAMSKLLAAGEQKQRKLVLEVVVYDGGGYLASDEFHSMFEDALFKTTYDPDPELCVGHRCARQVQ